MPDRPLIVVTPEDIPDSVARRLQAIADENPDAECFVAGYGVADLRVLAGMEPPHRPAGDPVVRWAEEFLGLPAGDAGAPGGVPGGVSEPDGEPVE